MKDAEAAESLREETGTYRPKGVLGKGVGNNKNASEMRQTCAKMGRVLLGKEEMSQKCVKNARKTFGGEHRLDDTEKKVQDIGFLKRRLTPGR